MVVKHINDHLVIITLKLLKYIGFFCYIIRYVWADLHSGTTGVEKEV